MQCMQRLAYIGAPRFVLQRRAEPGTHVHKLLQYGVQAHVVSSVVWAGTPSSSSSMHLLACGELHTRWTFDHAAGCVRWYHGYVQARAEP
jgi:hypothetical protein